MGTTIIPNQVTASNTVQTVELAKGLSTGAFGAGVSVGLITQVSAYTERFNDDRVWKTYSKLGGSAAYSNGEAVLSTGTNQYAYFSMITVQQSEYEPGKGMRMSWTTRFPTGDVVNGFQVAGPYHGEGGVGVGFDGTGNGFGFMHRYGRRFEIQTLEVTTPAAGAETVTVTLNGTAHAVPVTAGTVEDNAKEIAEYLSYADSGGLVDYDPYSLGAEVIFIRQSHGVVAGAFTATSSGALVASFSQTQAGAAGSQVWTYTGSWSIDPLDGTGPSGMVLDPTKGNIWVCTFGWLGYLGIQLWVADAATQRIVPVHFEPWSNTADATRPTVADPRFPMAYSVASLGSTTDMSLSGASCYIAIESSTVNAGGPRVAVTSRVTGVGTTEIPLESVMTAPVNLRHNTINRRRIILREIDISNVGSKDAIVNVYIGTQANLVGANFQAGDVDSILWSDSAATALTGTLDLIASVDVPGSAGAAGFVKIPLPAEGLPVYRGQVVVVTGETSASTTELVVAINGNEDL